tara:strand:+ start:129 stop:1517 length:1389 start_codon:yes stop_codon:yes gene_type:complete
MKEKIFSLPRMGETMEEGTVLTWFKSPGDSFKRGEVLLELETDKMVVEVPALEDGDLLEILASEQSTVEIGSSLALIGMKESVSKIKKGGVEEIQEIAKTKSYKEQDSLPQDSSMMDFTKDNFEILKPQTKDENVRSTPAARRLAKNNTISLKKVTGTGPMGRIEKKDVEEIINKIQKPSFADAKKTGGESAKKILEEQSLKIGDHQLNFQRRGVSGRTPLLFIHGFGSDSQTWRYSLGELSKTREVWAIDLPGHGKSLEFPMSYESKTLFNEYAKVLKEFLSNAGLKRVHLIGHSLGGGIALNFALNHLNSVSSLTLLAPMGLGNSINEKFIESFAKGESFQEIRESLNLLFYNNSWVTDSLVHPTVLQHQNPEFRKILGRLASILQKQGKQSWKVRDELQNLSIPVKLIWGKEDKILPFSHAQDLPGSFAVHTFPNTGHMVHIEQSKVINRLIGENSAQE